MSWDVSGIAGGAQDRAGRRVQQAGKAGHSKNAPTRPVGDGEPRFVSDQGEFSVRQVCHRGTPNGATRVFATRGRILPGSRNARFELSFLGGIRKQEYWVLETAPDGGWALMATPGGNYIWLLSRKAVMPAAARAAAIARIRALGYDQPLEFPAQAG